ncbi:hypothetical protein [Alkalicoccobacillus plakortidis]|uniref:Uncharacterized protein n=1 Tax=Alkalicoccobacillus plakortidis TaxID=444060 RepID=A0ABT0XIA8_9BACI|nr:hypothetical protein [Alkalicoccobacillus plakortidis]MCM2675607.1 hypothetical protein [Alkalicoccobacillus plakortidis]
MSAYSNVRPQLEGKEGRIITAVTVVSAIEYSTGVDVHVEDGAGNRFWIAESDVEWEEGETRRSERSR